MTLIEAVTAIALIGVVLAAVATVFTKMNDSSSAAEAAREADGLRAYLKGIAGQPRLCLGLFPAGTTYTVGTDQSLPQLIVVDGGSAASSLLPAGAKPTLTAGRPYGRYLMIDRIGLREPNAAYGEGGPVRTQTPANGLPYDTVLAKVTVDASPRVSYRSAQLRQIIVDMVLGLQGTNIVACVNQAYEPPIVGKTCSAATLNGNPPCVSDPNCQQVYYFSGFDPSGNLICKCLNSCLTGPRGLRGN
jgi:hypothetical protein